MHSLSSLSLSVQSCTILESYSLTVASATSWKIIVLCVYFKSLCHTSRTRLTSSFPACSRQTWLSSNWLTRGLLLPLLTLCSEWDDGASSSHSQTRVPWQANYTKLSQISAASFQGGFNICWVIMSGRLPADMAWGALFSGMLPPPVIYGLQNYWSWHAMFRYNVPKN